MVAKFKPRRQRLPWLLSFFHATVAIPTGLFMMLAGIFDDIPLLPPDTPWIVEVFLRIGGGIWLLVGVWQLRVGLRGRQLDVLRVRGTFGRARLISTTKTGTTVNDAPLLLLTVDLIQAEGLIRTTTEILVPVTALHTLTPGTELGVRFDPRDPRRLVVELD